MFSVEDDSGGDLETLSLPIIGDGGEVEPLAEDEETALLDYKSSWSCAHFITEFETCQQISHTFTPPAQFWI